MATEKIVFSSELTDGLVVHPLGQGVDEAFTVLRVRLEPIYSSTTPGNLINTVVHLVRREASGELCAKRLDAYTPYVVVSQPADEYECQVAREAAERADPRS